MSELKAGVIKTPHNEGISFDRCSDAIAVTEGETEFYLKSEADEVIKKLNERVSEEREAKVNYKISASDLSDGLRDAYDEIRHHKYKRCLVNAESCKHKAWYYCEAPKRYARRMRKWQQRWLEIAGQFKEVK